MVDVVGPIGIEVANRVVAKRGEVNDGIEATQILGRNVPYVFLQRLAAVCVCHEDAVGEIV